MLVIRGSSLGRASAAFHDGQRCFPHDNKWDLPREKIEGSKITVDVIDALKAIMLKLPCE